MGCVLVGRVNQVLPGQALLLSTPAGNGRVDITDISDSYLDNPLDAVPGKGGFVRYVAASVCVQCTLGECISQNLYCIALVNVADNMLHKF